MNISPKKQKLKYSDLIDKMTLSEKASLMSGANFWNTKSIERLGIPSIMLTDGPHGLRKQGGRADHLGLNKSIPSTCYPTAAALANSWDTELLEEVGSHLGREASSENVSVVLGPGLNIKRNPLCGRNFEYFSEDPYLSGKLAAAMIRGIQGEGVSACPKHFAVNSQETHRMILDEIVDERALHEIYLEGFRYAVQDGNPKCIMSSYNKVNGTHANENEYLLKDILRDNLGFKGLVVTDWGGNNDRVAGLIAGNALEMPSTNGMTDREIEEAVKGGILSEDLLDERVDEVLTLVLSTLPKTEKITKYSDSSEEYHKKAVEAACRSIVLLKNENKILPIRKDKKKIAVIGDFAKIPRYQGAGSSLIEPTKMDSFIEAIQNTDLNIIGYEKGFHRLGGKSELLKKRACRLAEMADTVLLFLGLDEGSEAEGVDRKHMRLAKSQTELLESIALLRKDIVLILAGGAPVEMPFVNKVQAIVHGYLPGQGGGSAIAKVITGEYNPSGKLAESYPLSYDDVASCGYYPGEYITAEHRESIYVGYRHYDTAGKNVLFPFGFGLSYTTFDYTNIAYKNGEITLTVANTGSCDGEEVVQVYIKPLNRNIFHAEKELKGFSKVMLKKGEAKQIIIKLDEHAFAYYHTELKRWVTDGGQYQLLAGASSRDIRLKINLNVNGETVELPYEEGSIPKYENCDVDNLTSSDFEKLTGVKMPVSVWNTRKVLGINDIFEQAKYGGIFGRLVYVIINAAYNLLKFMGKPIKANNVKFVMELPFRSMARMSGGLINMEMLDGFMKMINGSFFKGFIIFIKSKNVK